MHQSNATPKVSAYAHLSDKFKYNKMPLAPMRCATQIHEKTGTRGMWAYHTVDGWYPTTTSPEYYRTHRCYVKTTRSDRLTNTAQFSHKNITHPAIMHVDKAMNTITNCAKSTKGAGQSDSKNEMQQLQQLVELTKQAA